MPRPRFGREAVERCRYDLRWKAALHLDAVSIDAPFAKSTLQMFRTRLTLHEKEGVLFERSVRAARDAGLLPRRPCIALDTTPIRGRGAVKDTYNLLSNAVRRVVRKLASEKGLPVEEVARSAALERHLGPKSIKGCDELDGNDPEEVASFLAGLLEDCDRALLLARDAACAGEEAKLLERVVAQDVDREGPDGAPEVKQGAAKGRVPSVNDPEMRHGHKSNGKGYTGHKAHVAVEPTSGVVTDVDVTAPSTPEGSKVGEMVGESARRTGSEVDEALAVGGSTEPTGVAPRPQSTLEGRTRTPPGRTSRPHELPSGRRGAPESSRREWGSRPSL